MTFARRQIEGLAPLVRIAIDPLASMLAIGVALLAGGALLSL